MYCFNKFNYGVFSQETVARFLAVRQHRDSNGRAFLNNLKHFLKVNYKELGIGEEERLDIIEVEIPKQTGRTKQRMIVPIPHDQIPLLENALPTEQLKLQLLVSYYCALRLGELLKIGIMNFNWQEWRKDKESMGECRVFGKGDKEGIALVPSFLMKRLSSFILNGNYSSADAKVFMGKSKKITLATSASSWQKKLKKAGVQSGLTQLNAEGAPIKSTVVYPHRLRHSYASYLINEKNMDIRHVQEVLRHTSIASTQIYTHIDKEKLKRRLSMELSKPEVEEDYSPPSSSSESSSLSESSSGSSSGSS